MIPEALHLLFVAFEIVQVNQPGTPYLLAFDLTFAHQQSNVIGCVLTLPRSLSHQNEVGHKAAECSPLLGVACLFIIEEMALFPEALLLWASLTPVVALFQHKKSDSDPLARAALWLRS